MLIEEISDIRTGLILSRKQVDNLKNNGSKYKIITLKSIDNNGVLNKNFFDEFMSKEQISKEFISKEGDIIFRYSWPHTSAYITKKLEGYVIPSQFCILRVKHKKYLPEYVQYVLNSNNMKKDISRLVMGSKISIITLTNIKNLEIPEANIKYQNMIVNLNRLHINEKRLLSELLSEKEKEYRINEKVFFENIRRNK